MSGAGGAGEEEGGPALLSPPCQPCCQQPCLFPAYAADGNLPKLLAQLCRCCECWGSGAVGQKLQSTGWCCALLHCSGSGRAILGRAATQGGGGQQFGGCSPHPRALVLPVPAWTSPCGASIAGTRLAGAGSPGRGCRLWWGRRAVGVDDWQHEGEGAAWEPSRGPGAGAASGGVNIAPTHGDVTWATVTGPPLPWRGLVALLWLPPR